jgi:hypothetical protein
VALPPVSEHDRIALLAELAKMDASVSTARRNPSRDTVQRHGGMISFGISGPAVGATIAGFALVVTSAALPITGGALAAGSALVGAVSYARAMRPSNQSRLREIIDRELPYPARDGNHQLRAKHMIDRAPLWTSLFENFKSLDNHRQKKSAADLSAGIHRYEFPGE